MKHIITHFWASPPRGCVKYRPLLHIRDFTCTLTCFSHRPLPELNLTTNMHPSPEQFCGSERLLFGSWSDLEVRILNPKQIWIILNCKFVFLSLTFYVGFVFLKFRLFGFIHNFFFFYSEFVCYLYYKKYIFNLLDFWLFMVGSGSKRFGSERIRIRNIAPECCAF